MNLRWVNREVDDGIGYGPTMKLVLQMEKTTYAPIKGSSATRAFMEWVDVPVEEETK